MNASGRYGGWSILVTGAQGFLGSWLADRLLDEGARVIVPRRDVPAMSRFRLECVEERCDVVQADILDYVHSSESSTNTPSGQSFTWRRRRLWGPPTALRSRLTRPTCAARTTCSRHAGRRA